MFIDCLSSLLNTKVQDYKDGWGLALRGGSSVCVGLSIRANNEGSVLWCRELPQNFRAS